MVTTAELAWLAGILDGEGSITMGLERKSQLFNPMVHIVNTDQGIIDECLRLLAALGCTVSAKWKSRDGALGKKPLMRIQVSSHASVARLLEAVLPYLRSTKRKARGGTMLEFVRSRLPKINSGPSDARGYTAREVELGLQTRNQL